MKKFPNGKIPGGVWDTVLVPMPHAVGNSYVLFRDLADKGAALCNLTQARRLAAGDRLVVNRLRVEFGHWSGDNMLGQLMLLGTLDFQVNRRSYYEGPLLGAVGSDWDEMDDGGIAINDSDDISARITVAKTPWPVPTLTEWKNDNFENSDEELVYPGVPLSIRRFLPKLRHSRTVLSPVSRPMKGDCLVTVKLMGHITRSLGA